MKRIILIIIFSVFNLHSFSQTAMLEKYNLMPWPLEIEENNQKFIIEANFTISVNDIENVRIFKATTSFLRRLSGRTGIFIENGFAMNSSKIKTPSLLINFDRVGKLELNEDESYKLSITNKQITIEAITDIGVLRALETLLQLSSHSKTEYYFEGVLINDKPRFPWRGLMIDVARHFEPVDVLKRNLDAMASVKLNVFHWHLTDDQGFRVQVESLPKLHKLGSDMQYYTHNDIRAVVQYASDLGIRVVPEFDVPGHATAILTAYPELGSKEGYDYAIERFAGVFDPTLDPTNDNTYEFLTNLFTEMAGLFPDKYFHIGGDENEGKHWNENKKIQKFKEENNLKTNHDLQTYFNIKLEKILKKLDKNLMGWDEIMTPNMPTTAVIHSWRGEHEGLAKGGSLIEAAKKGYQTVLSNGYYIDRMQSVFDHYSVDPTADVNLTNVEEARILGGEATMWSELVTPLTIDSRIWPRTAAIAERFWSPKDINDAFNMYKRLDVISFRLEELGITHIKNKDVILRNITNNQDIEALKVLTKICEPLKIYSRNSGGTEYKSFSPFTLFADACTTDAIDAIYFNQKVDSYYENPIKSNEVELISFLDKWITNNREFVKINNNPTLNILAPLSRNLAELALIIKESLIKGELGRNNHVKSMALIEKLSKPTADTELSIVPGLKKLILSFDKKNIKP